MTSPTLAHAAVARRRILYVSTFTSPGTTTSRCEAMRRIGQDVVPFEFRKYEPRSGPLRIFRSRLPFGPLVSRINQDLLSSIKASRPDVVWFDKPTLFTRETMDAIHSAGARIVFYVQDGPFGPRNDGVWRQFYRVYRMADLHCLVREADVARYRAWGLPVHQDHVQLRSGNAVRNPVEGWSDADRDRGISYIGHPHEERPAFLRTLAKQYNLPLSINGNFWREILGG